MDAWMPYFQHDFLVSDAGRLGFAVWAIVLVVCHMQYVHGAVDISKRFTVLELLADLVGLTWMRNLCAHDFPQLPGLQVFLFVHFAVHLLSLAWALLAWPSLDAHMRAFRRRQLPTAFVASEWLYEQSDTALYTVLALRILTQQGPVVAMVAVILVSALARSRRFRSWFAVQRQPA